MDLVFLWGNKQGNTVLKNILTTANTEAKDGGVSQLTKWEKSREGGREHGGGRLETDVQSGKKLLFLQDGLSLTSCNGKFFILIQLSLPVLCSLQLNMELGFGDAANAGRS